MHNERVSRHCKGINQALSDLKHRFGQMTEEHNQLATQFRDDIEALEIVFINATKSSKYVVADYIIIQVQGGPKKNKTETHQNYRH